MKRVFGLVILLSLTISSFAACAGVKEAGGDESVLFQCVSAPYVDSNLKVIGVSKELESGVDLLVFVNGKLLEQDTGVLAPEVGQYIGKVFDIQFGSDESLPSTITAKLESAVLHAGGADTLICTFEK